MSHFFSNIFWSMFILQYHPENNMNDGVNDIFMKLQASGERLKKNPFRVPMIINPPIIARGRNFLLLNLFFIIPPSRFNYYRICSPLLETIHRKSSGSSRTRILYYIGYSSTTRIISCCIFITIIRGNSCIS